MNKSTLILTVAVALLGVSVYAQGPYVGPNVTIEAECTDAISGCAGVQFTVDGVAINSEDTTPDADGVTYSTVWDASAVSEGQHDISCIGRDVAGNVGDCANTVTVFVDRTAPNTTVRIPPPGQQ